MLNVFGKRVVGFMISMQVPPALSLGEAEVYGAVKSASRLLWAMCLQISAANFL